MSSITSPSDTGLIISSFLDPDSFQNALNACKRWQSVLQSPKSLQSYASLLSMQKIEAVSPCLFRYLLPYFSVAQAAQFGGKKIRRILLSRIRETPENKLTLRVAKFMASSYELESRYEPKFNHRYLIDLQFFLLNDSCICEKRGWYSQPPEKEAPPFLAADWNDLQALDKEKLTTVLQVEFARHEILNFDHTGAITLPTILFEPFCLSIQFRKNPANFLNIIVRDDQQLSFLSKCVMSWKDSYSPISIFIGDSVSVEGICALKRYFQEVEDNKIISHIIESIKTQAAPSDVEIREALCDFWEMMLEKKRH